MRRLHVKAAVVEVLAGGVRDLPLWRRLVVETLTGLARGVPAPVGGRMCVIDAGYRAEVCGRYPVGGCRCQ